MRLDEYLFQNNLAPSRNKAVNLIENNLVKVNDIVINKKNYLIKTNDIVQVVTPCENYVSRAGEKLAFAIKTFDVSIKNKTVLDIGASTGGFSDVCLQNGARKIFCVDVGTNQLAQQIKINTKIIDISPMNVKNLNDKVITDSIDIIVSDLSFISSKYMFAVISKLKINKPLHIISMIKPQFELTPKDVSKHKGKVCDVQLHEKAIMNVKNYAIENNCKVIQIIESPILGAKKQNKEFIMWAVYE